MNRIAVFTAGMKTTIDFPPDVLREAKILAASKQTTLKDLVVEAVRKLTADDAEPDEKSRQKEIKNLLAQMRASNESKMQPLTREEIYDR